MLVSEFNLRLEDGSTLHVYDTGAVDPERWKEPPTHASVPANDRTGGRDGEATAPPPITVMWHHGTPNIGTPPAPLFAISDKLGIRWVSYDRPGYGESSPQPGRDLASAATYTAHVADALGIDRFAVMGHSGGGSHALACGALLADRVVCVASVAGLAPINAGGLNWFDGMFASGAKLRAAANGRAALEENMRHSAYDPEMFTASDHAALSGVWGWFHEVVGPAMKSGPEGQIADDLAYATPWGFDPRDVMAPTLLLHGDQDRIAPSAHAKWLSRRCPKAELRLHPQDGHISVLNHAPSALEWVCAHADRD